jgi:hypothetical protein
MRKGVGLVRLIVLIACIVHEKIVPRHDMECIVGTEKIIPLYLRFMDLALFLVCGGHSMTSTFYIDPIFCNTSNRRCTTCNYKVMNNEYAMGYYLADGLDNFCEGSPR